METTDRLGVKLKELFEVLPLDFAMPTLLGGDIQSKGHAMVGKIQTLPVIMAGLWLYVDDLDRSHTLSQGVPTATGAYWHGIMHRREGDFSNSKYWFRQAGSHPAMSEIGYDPYRFVDECGADRGRNEARLLELQRREWKALFDWCVAEVH